MANYANKKEFRKALLYALGVEKSLAEVDKEEFREGILQGLNASYTAEDLNVKDKFRAKLVEAVAEAMAGGDSDLSTAEVTFVCETEGMEQGFSGAWIYKDDDEEQSSLHYYLSAPESSPATATVVLYKGKTVISPAYPAETAMTATGDAEYDLAHSKVVITGDCTITYSVEI